MSEQKEVVRDFKGRGVIRTLKGSKNYYMRFGFNDQKGWTPWRKTGTSDFQEASKIASEEYRNLSDRLASANVKMDVSKIYDEYTFIGTARRWLEMYRLKAEAGLPVSGRGKPASLAQHKSYEELVDRYMAVFFENKNLDSFKDQDIIDYIKWRRAYYTTGPGSQIDTIEITRNDKPYRHKVKHETVELRSGELATIRAIFKFAGKEGLITEKQIPEIRRSSKGVKDIKKTRYPAFSKEHWKIVESKIDAYTRTPNENDRKARIGFKYFMLIMVETGLRHSNEHPSIKWRHIEFDTAEETGEEIAYINVPDDAKTGYRLVIVGPHGTRLLRELEAWTAFGGQEDPIFANQQTGEAVKRYSGAFSKFLKFCGIEKSKDDKDYAPYSLRHTYATRLREGGLEDQVIARLMGHADTEMIEKHYGQDELTSHTDKIVAAGRRRVAKKVAKPTEFEKSILADAVLSLPSTENQEFVLEEDDGTGPKVVIK